MSATAAKIALVSSTAALSGACPTGGSVVDFVGFGAANCSLGSPAPTLTNTTADLRGAAGCTNNGDNSTDFAAGAPSPRNSISAAHLCTGGVEITITPATLANATVSVPYSTAFTATGGTSPYTFAVSAGTLPDNFHLTADGILSGTATASGNASFSVTAIDASGQMATAAYTLTVDAAPTCSATATIAQVQGAGRCLSPERNHGNHTGRCHRYGRKWVFHADAGG